MSSGSAISHSTSKDDRAAHAPLAIAILVTLVLWGSAYALIRMSLTAYGPGELALLRFMIASMVLLVLARLKRTPPPRREDLRLVLALGLFGIAIYHVALNWGEVTTPAGTASLLIATAPVCTALLATALLGDRPGLRGWGGICISSVGVALVVRGKGGPIAIDGHALLVLVASLCASIYAVMQKPYLGKYSAFQLSCYATWTGTLLLMIFLPRLVTQFHRAPWKTTAAAGYLGVFPAAIGNLTWTYTLSRWPASRAMTLLYLIPPVAVLFGWLLMGEVPAPMTIAGGAVVVAGVALVNSRRTAKPAMPVVAEAVLELE